MKTVNFIRMEDGTAAEYAFLDDLEEQYKAELPNRLIESLAKLETTLSGYQISDTPRFDFGPCLCSIYSHPTEGANIYSQRKSKTFCYILS